MKKDTLFQSDTPMAPFVFNKAVSDVFDDMLIRSIPHYLGIQTMISDFCYQFYKPNTILYDLGCSTGNTFFTLDEGSLPPFNYIGIDYSKDMLAQFSDKLGSGRDGSVQLIHYDLNQPVDLDPSSVIIINLTLQFLNPVSRRHLLKCCLESLLPGGVLLLIEKVKGSSIELDTLFTKKYYEFKLQKGYSELEIQRKKEALTGILEPYTYDQNVDLLSQSGFNIIECFFRWYNFCGLIAQRS